MTSLTLRPWQAEFLDVLSSHPTDDFLLVACPAAGKTIAAGAGVAQVLEEREADQLVIVAPTVVVRDQWEAELDKLGYRMLHRLAGRGWPAWVHGVCLTYAAAAFNAEALAEACERRRTVVVFDEVHHAGSKLTWGSGIEEAFAGAEFRLHLSGTPFRSDRDRIPFVRYDEDGACIPDFSYDYRRAVADGVCRPVEFRVHDGEITWSAGEEEASAAFTDDIAVTDRPRRLRAALDPSQAYLRGVLEAANQDLAELRTQIPDAAGLVVCDSQQHAHEVDRLITEIDGSVPTLALSDLPRSHQAIAAFSRETEPWLVSVRMVAEGVDIPRLGVVVWATTSSTELMVRQVAGRALRGRREYLKLPAVVHMPADPQLVEYAQRLDVLAGVSKRKDDHSGPSGRHGGGGRAPKKVECLAATPSGAPRAIRPTLPRPDQLVAVPDPIDVAAPELPPSPRDLREMGEQRERDRADLYQLLNVYMRLRRHDTPTFALPAANAELAEAVGVIDAEASDALVGEALDWLRERTASLAIANPDLVKELAREKRRAAIRRAA
jgi:superfamily II DNA or RNA helicase